LVGRGFVVQEEQLAAQCSHKVKEMQIFARI
jgi:hypothetical protein